MLFISYLLLFLAYYLSILLSYHPPLLLSHHEQPACPHSLLSMNELDDESDSDRPTVTAKRMWVHETICSRQQ